MTVVVMNVVKAIEDRAAEFEQAFLTRERLLNQAEGFLGFELLRRDRGSEYVVLTRWESEDAFRDWVRSDLFKRSHRRDRGRGLASGNEIRTYEVIDVEVPA
jgi:heme-degrading monooxygenase HmoA